MENLHFVISLNLVDYDKLIVSIFYYAILDEKFIPKPKN